MPASFDGTDELRSDFGSTALTGHTICGWAKQDTAQDWGTAFGFSIGGATTDYLYFQTNDAATRVMQASVRGNNQNGTELDLHDEEDDAWYFYCVWVDDAGNDYGAYWRRFDAAMSSDSKNYTRSVTVDEVLIGESVWGGEDWAGSVAAVKWWDTILTADEAMNESLFYMPQRLANLQSFYPLLTDQDWVDYGPNGDDLVEGGTVTHDPDGPPIAWAPISPRLLLPAAAGGTPATVTPGVIAAVAALPAVAVVGGANVTPGPVAATAALPAPTVIGSTTVRPGEVAAVAALPAPTVIGSTTVRPGPVAAVAALPTATAASPITVTPGEVAAVAALPDPTILVGGTIVTPGEVAAIAALPTATAFGTTTVRPGPVAAVAALPAVTVVGTTTVRPGPVAAIAAFPAVTVIGSTTVRPSAIAAVASLPAVTVVGGAVVTPGEIAAVAALPAVTILVGGAVVFPSPVAAVTALPAVTVVGGANVSPGPVAAVAALPAATAVSPKIVTPGPVAALAAFPAVTLVGGAVVTPGQIAAVAALPAVSILTGDTVVSPGVIAALAAFPAVTILVTDAEVVVDQGNWWTLVAILEDARAEHEHARDTDPVACPNDGEPLLADRHGLYCPYDGWRPVPIAFAESLPGGVQWGSYDPPRGRRDFNRGG